MDDFHGENQSMIPVDKVPLPDRFNECVRDAGSDWLGKNPEAKSKDFPSLWSQFRSELAIGFNDLCGYSVIFTRPGTVDHYISKESRQGRALVYEWSNYRYASSLMNQRKGTWNARILDPFEIGPGWFEILLPHLEMVLVEKRIPPQWLEDARFTLKTLGLGDDEEILEGRRHWYEQFVQGDLTLKGLTQRAPLIAEAVKKRLDEINVALLDEARGWFDEFCCGVHALGTLRARTPSLAEQIEVLLARPDERVLRRS